MSSSTDNMMTKATAEHLNKLLAENYVLARDARRVLVLHHAADYRPTGNSGKPFGENNYIADKAGLLPLEEVYAAIEQAYTAAYAAALEQEIREAALSRRMAVHTYSPLRLQRDIGYNGSRMPCRMPFSNQGAQIFIEFEGETTRFSETMWDIAAAEIDAIIAADNAVRASRYEAYRLACEQGVAVPPAGQEDE